MMVFLRNLVFSPYIIVGVSVLVLAGLMDLAMPAVFRSINLNLLSLFSQR